jgi:hypothetical protein
MEYENFLKIKHPSNFFGYQLDPCIEIWQLSFQEIKILAIKSWLKMKYRFFYLKASFQISGYVFHPCIEIWQLSFFKFKLWQSKMLAKSEIISF